MKRLLIALCCVAGVSSATRYPGRAARRDRQRRGVRAALRRRALLLSRRRGNRRGLERVRRPRRVPRAPGPGRGRPRCRARAAVRAARPRDRDRAVAAAGARDRRARRLAGRVAVPRRRRGSAARRVSCRAHEPASPRWRPRRRARVPMATCHHVDRRPGVRRPRRRRARARPAGAGRPRAVGRGRRASSRCRGPERAAGGRRARAPDARRRSRHQPRRRRGRLERVPALLSVLAGSHERPAGGLGRAASASLAGGGRGHDEGAAARGPSAASSPTRTTGTAG